MTKLLLTNKNNVNPFPTNVLLLYPLKTSENLQFSNVLRGGYRSGALVENGSMIRSMFETILSPIL